MARRIYIYRSGAMNNCALMAAKGPRLEAGIDSAWD